MTSYDYYYDLNDLFISRELLYEKATLGTLRFYK